MMPVILKGACSHFTGYGRLFRGLAERLQPRLDIEVLALDNYVPEGYPLDICQRATGLHLGVLFGDPTRIHQLSTRYRVLYTMCEASDIPRDWKRDLRHCDEIWVPSTFCAEIFRASGRNALVLPFGYDETVFNHKEWSVEDRKNFWQLRAPELVGKCVVGTAGVMSKRKGIDLLLKAWEVAAMPDAWLVVKTRDTRIDLFTRPVPNVLVVDTNWSDEVMADFYRSIDLFVLASRGEGLGLPPLEAAACGTPAIVTRATGPADYIDDRGIYGLGTRGTSQTEGMVGLPVHAQWVEPDGAALVDMLREFVYATPAVEHRYRQWSMGWLAERWEAELHAAARRAYNEPRATV